MKYWIFVRMYDATSIDLKQVFIVVAIISIIEMLKNGPINETI